MTDAIRVLYVDDEHGLLDLGKLFLERTGNFSVTLIDSASAALDLLQTEKFDAIVSDYQMPEMDGIAFLKKLKASGNPIPFILFTGKGREVVVIEALNEGAAFYLQKGGEPKSQFAELSHKIRQAVSRKRAEETLRESELFLKETQQIARLGGWKANPHTDYLVWTDGIYDIIEAPRDYRPGLTEGMKYYSPEDIPVIREKIAACLATGEPFAIEVQIITETGKKVWTELRGLSPVIEGTRSYVKGTLQDITEQKRVEKSLRESGRQLNSMATNIPGVVYRFCVNPDGTYGFDYISEHSRQILGLENDPVTFFNRVVEGIVPEDRERFISSVQHAISTKTLWEFDGWYVKPSGKKIWFGAVSSPVMENERLVFDGVVFDNTDRKRAEYELLKKNEELNASYEQIAASDEELRRQYKELAQSEQLIRESETKFRELAELLPQMVFEVDLGFWVTYANQIALTNMRVADKDLEAGVSALSFIDPSDRERIRQNVEKIFRGETVANHEYTAVRGDGNTFPVMIYAAPISRFGKPAGIRGIIVDITDRKKAEEELKESEERFKTLFEKSAEAQLLLDGTGKVAECNAALLTLFALKDKEEIRGHSPEDFAPEFQPDGVRSSSLGDEIFARVMKEGMVQYEWAHLKHDPARTPILTDVICTLIMIAGQPMIHASIRDITDRKRAQDTLREREATLSSIFRAAPVGIGLVSNRVILRANDRLCEMTGYSAGGLVGKSARILYPDDEEFDRAGREKYELIRKYGTGTVETRWQRKDGAIRDVLLSSTPLDPENHATGVTFTVLDITERKQAEEVLRKNEEQLRNTIDLVNDGIQINQIGPDGKPGKFIEVNEVACRMLQYTRKELLERGPFDIVTGYHSRPVPEILEELSSTGHSLFETEHRRKDGTVVPVEINANIVNLQGQQQLISVVRDITEHKRVEQALRESEEKYRAILKASPDSITITDLKGVISMVTPATLTILGFEREDDILGHSIADFFVPEDWERAAADISLMHQGVFQGPLEYRAIHADGSVFDIEAHGEFIRDANGQPASMVFIARDITRRMQVEKALQESEHFNSSILKLTPNIVYIRDLNEHRIVYTNKGIADTLGYTPEQLTTFGPKWYITLLHPDDVQTMDRHYNQMKIKKDGEVVECEYRMKHANGTWVIHRNQDVVFLRNQQGEVTQILGSAEDITKRKVTEQALAESESFNRGLVDNLPEYLSVYGQDGKILYVNPASARALGFEADEVIGTHILSYVSEEYRGSVTARMAARQNGGDISSYEIEMITKDGQRRSVIVKASPIQYQNNPATLLLLIDITERKRDEEALQQSEARFRTIIHSMQFGIVIIDAKTHTILEANAKALEMIGSSNDTIVGSVCHRFICPAETGRCPVTDLGQNVDSSERILLNLRGEKVPILKSVIKTMLGGKDVLIESFIDITERKRAEENLAAELKRSQEQQVALGTISLSSHLFSGDVHGLSTRLTEVSSGVLGVERASVWLFNSERDELRCIDLYESSHNRHSFEGVLKRHEYVNEFDALSSALFIDAHDPLTDPRTAGYVEGYLKPNRITSMLDAVVRVSGQNLGVLCFEHVDRQHHWEIDEIAFACQLADQIAITLLNRDRKRAEAALKENEEKYRFLIENSHDIIYTITPQGVFTYVSPAWTALLGHPVTGVVGKLFQQFVYPDDIAECWAFMQRTIDTGERQTGVEYRVQHADGSWRWHTSNAVPLKDESGMIVGFEGSASDITGKKELEMEMEYHAQELQQYSTSLATANKKLNILSSITRHDINNQLAILMGYLTILEKQLPDTSFSDYFLRVSNAAKRISAMVQFTREYEEIGVKAPAWQDTRTLVDTAAKQAPLGMVLVKNDLPAGAEVFADPLVVKVFYNLMDNAVRYGGKITTIRFSVDELDGDHVVVCEDDGDGIVAAEKEKIFERGFGKNTGLGLALSREILSITGITITETGEPGKGARFEMTVPKGMWRMAGKGD